MVRGRPLSDDLRAAIVHMAHSLDIDSIVHFSGCKKRTVQRVLAEFRDTGTSTRSRLRRQLCGPKRVLTRADVGVSRDSLLSRVNSNQNEQFLRGTIQHTPDIYLDELRELLKQRCGVDADEVTLWRALKRSGFTMKKVCTTGHSWRAIQN